MKSNRVIDNRLLQLLCLSQTMSYYPIRTVSLARPSICLSHSPFVGFKNIYWRWPTRRDADLRLSHPPTLDFEILVLGLVTFVFVSWWCPPKQGKLSQTTLASSPNLSPALPSLHSTRLDPPPVPPMSTVQKCRGLRQSPELLSCQIRLTKRMVLLVSHRLNSILHSPFPGKPVSGEEMFFFTSGEATQFNVSSWQGLKDPGGGDHLCVRGNFCLEMFINVSEVAGQLVNRVPKFL